jgi:hypothetical protein
VETPTSRLCLAWETGASHAPADHEKTLADAAGRERMSLHFEMARWVSELTGLAQAFQARQAQERAAAAATAAGAASGAGATEAAEATAVPSRSQVLIEMNVVDDMSTLELPKMLEEETVVMQMVDVSVNCNADLVHGVGTFYCPDSSASGKNCDAALNECFLNKVVSGMGARVFVMISDMGLLKFNLAVAVLYAQFLCDIGMYDIVIVGYLQRLHSKYFCDLMCVCCL